MSCLVNFYTNEQPHLPLGYRFNKKWTFSFTLSLRMELYEVQTDGLLTPILPILKTKLINK